MQPFENDDITSDRNVRALIFELHFVTPGTIDIYKW